MRSFFITGAIALAAATSGFSQTITIEAADGFRFIRCVDMFGSASCEYISNSTNMMSCIALDAAGEPLAVSPAFGGSGAVTFPNLPVTEISDVICE